MMFLTYCRTYTRKVLSVVITWVMIEAPSALPSVEVSERMAPVSPDNASLILEKKGAGYITLTFRLTN